MAVHEFGILQKAPMHGNRFDEYEPERYSCVSADDAFIEDRLWDFMILPCYAHSIDLPCSGLCDCGVTLIPPHGRCSGWCIRTGIWMLWQNYSHGQTRITNGSFITDCETVTMKEFFAAYYKAFSCIADACRHSCCIGWEIDIDEESAGGYRTFPGEIGERMRAVIDFHADPPHFILQGEEERCPFLNRNGLCDLILTCGEGALCQICRDHPRWRNFFSDRTETGLGLCCEAACALILGYEAPVTMVCGSDDGAACMLTEEESAFFALREDLLAILQNREMPINVRIDRMLAFVDAPYVRRPMCEWTAFLSELEILDPAWSELLHGMDGTREALPLHAGEQLLVYIIHRHLPKILDGEDTAAVVSFAAFVYDLTSALYAKTDGGFDALTEIVRLLSSELEYSEDNLYAILDALKASEFNE